MSGWWFSASATSARRSTNAIASGNDANSSSRSSAPSASAQAHGPEYGGPAALVAEAAARYGAALRVRLPAARAPRRAWRSLPLRVPPPAVVLAAGGDRAGRRLGLGSGQLVAAALLLQLKTVLDNADGQLARATGRVTVLGRYLDSESDCSSNAALFAALGCGDRQVGGSRAARFRRA